MDRKNFALRAPKDLGLRPPDQGTPSRTLTPVTLAGRRHPETCSLFTVFFIRLLHARLWGSFARSLARWRPMGGDESFGVLERLSAKHLTDKERLQHKYVDAYASIFDPRRLTFRNVTEVGVWRGASANTFVEYFPNADIWALDTQLGRYRAPVATQRKDPRLHLIRCCSGAEELARAGLVANSMDLVIEDAGEHELALQLALFELMWPLVRPGGFYVIEDVDPQRGGRAYIEDHRALSPLMQRVLEENYAFEVDATPGITPERWLGWQHKMRTCCAVKYVESRAVHNSHLLVIQRRRGPPPAPSGQAGVVPRGRPPLRARAARGGDNASAPLVGTCAVTTVGGDCGSGERGAWHMPHGSLSACARRCDECARCRFVSFSRTNADCSWFSECDLDALTTLALTPQANGASYRTMQVKGAERA